MAGVVLAIGKFESIHQGHKALLVETVRHAKEKKLTPAAMVFEPHPSKVLGNTHYKPLFTEAERTYLITKCGVDKILTCHFDKAFSKLSPIAFCKKIFNEYKAREIIVGENYRFGFKREGTVETLQYEASKFGAKVSVVKMAKNIDNLPISTSIIRSLLVENRLPEANAMLGFPFFTMGITEKGRQLGRTLGFPTLNIYPDENKFLPADGVYSTRVTLDGEAMQSITNIGFRPTVNASHAMVHRSVETHILNSVGHFKEETYHRPIKVEFLKFIRSEKRFDTLDELKQQILQDIHFAT
ncbi:MAG: riboflavin biosynthesis protein RibF [Defluviitaleaceae bacterium]|nr:riboflavin biosynthesis protein RibF [Defluviitaleaceae bacterium]